MSEPPRGLSQLNNLSTKLDQAQGAFGGLKGFFFSGEGLVADFTGQGTVYLQTRNPTSLAAFLQPFRPVNNG